MIATNLSDLLLTFSILQQFQFSIISSTNHTSLNVVGYADGVLSWSPFSWAFPGYSDQRYRTEREFLEKIGLDTKILHG